MPLINPILKPIAEAIPDVVYMRASDLEANVDVDQIDLEGKTLVIYYNRPTVDNKTGASGKHVVRQWPVEIHILQLAEVDDGEEDSDTIRAACIAIADKIFDMMQIAAESSSESITDYALIFGEEQTIFDKLLTGVTLNFTYPIDRTTYYC